MILFNEVKSINFFLLISTFYFFSYIKPFNSLSFLPLHWVFITIAFTFASANIKLLKQIICNKYIVLIFGFLILIALQTIVLKNNLQGLFDYLVKLVIMPFILMFISIDFIVTTKKIKSFWVYFLIPSIVTSLVAILQYLQMDFFWEIRSYLQQFSPKDKGIEAILISRHRPVGFAYFFITLSYQLLIGLMAALYYYSYRKSLKLFKGSLVIIIWCALLVSLTRSAILGILLAVFVLYIKDKKITVNKIFLLFGFVCLAVYTLLFSRDIIDLSTLNRIYLAMLGWYVYLDNWFLGIGLDTYTNYTKFYFRYLPENVSEDVYRQSSHNSYLNALILFGSFILIPFIALYAMLYRYINIIKKFDRGIAIVLWLYFISYSVHVFFHNAGIFFYDHLVWLIIGYVIGIKIVFTTKEQKNDVSNNALT